MKKLSLLILLVSPALAISAWAKSGSVSFANIKDGATITNGTVIKFAVKDVKVAPAGKPVEGTGHHHLLIDSGPMAEGEIIPADATHVHFGKGQTEANLQTTPGAHTLTLQFADGEHRSYGPKLSATVHVTVK